MIKKYLHVFFIIILIIIIITVNDKEPNINRVEFDSLFNKISTLKIMQDDNSIVTDNIKFIIDDKKLYIASSNNIIRVFDKSGNYKFSFGNMGNGPGEFQIISEIFDLGNVVCIYDALSWKISLFSKNGQFLNSYKIPFKYIYDIKKIEQGYLLYIPNLPNYNYNLVLLDTLFNFEKGILPGNEEFMGLSTSNLFSGFVELNEDILYEINMYSCGILRIVNTKTLAVKSKELTTLLEIFNCPIKVKKKYIRNLDDYLENVKILTKIIIGSFIDPDNLFLVISNYRDDKMQLKYYFIEDKKGSVTELVNPKLIIKKIGNYFYFLNHNFEETKNGFVLKGLELHQYEFKKNSSH